MKKTAFLFICMLLCLGICACSAEKLPNTNTDVSASENTADTESTAEPEVIVAPYERVGSKTLSGRFIAPLPFEEAFSEAALCVTVQINGLVEYFMYENGFIGNSVFSASIIETHANRIGYDQTEIFITQLGTPVATIRTLPLFNVGDRLLLNLKPSSEDAPWYEKYSDSFAIINGPSGVIQLTEYNGATYAVDRSLSSYFKDTSEVAIPKTDSATQTAVIQSLTGRDPVLQGRVTAEKDTYLYRDILSYIEKLREETS